jgi:hypothetical protein
MIDLPIIEWLAISFFSGWPQFAGLALAATMRNHAMPQGCRPAEPYEHNLD